MAVARRHGVEVREPRVLSDRSNLIVGLAPAPVVARVATTTAAVRAGGARDWLARDVALGGHLAAAGADAVPPARRPPAGPHMEDGLAIAFWQFVEHDSSKPPSPREAGRALRGIHEALADFAGPLPPFAAVLDECEVVLERLGAAASAHVSAAVLARMRAALEDIRSEVAAAGLPPRPLHGDATPSNLLRTPAGLVWTDFEDTCVAPVEWDLACLASSAGPGAGEALEAYGRSWPDEALAPFLGTRRLQVALWTALVAERHPELLARAEERLSAWAARS
jgi:Phosphotransferase enzyme family